MKRKITVRVARQNSLNHFLIYLLQPESSGADQISPLRLRHFDDFRFWQIGLQHFPASFVQILVHDSKDLALALLTSSC